MSEHRIAVAYSGGRDSSAMLHATLAAAGGQGIRVIALHVHHGLSTHADAWLAHCHAQCRRWARAGRPVELITHRLGGRPAKGESVEAWARQARYEALREMALAHGVQVVLLAHHQRDQAETFLLQALRGAGAKGLSAMPRSVVREGIQWERPWLDKPRAAIDAYVRRYRLAHVEDDSNDNPRFARNGLRLEVWPALTGSFAQADTALARAAAWAQQASALMDEVAAEDLARLESEGALRVVPWLSLSVARRTNALRAWIKACGGASPSAATLVRLLAELAHRQRGRWPLEGGELRLHRGGLRWCTLAANAERDAAPRETSLSIKGAGLYALPGWKGDLRVDPVASAGVPLAWLACLELRPRTGGERFQAGPGRPPRSLKKQYQGANLSEWERSGPLVYSGGQLVYVPGLGLDARLLGLPGQPLVHLAWQPARER